LLFFIASFYIIKFFTISIFSRYTDIHNCSKLPFFLTHLEFSQHRISVRKRSKDVKPIAVLQSNWSTMAHYLLSVKNSYEQNFSSRGFWGIFELKKLCITQNKKNSPACFNRVLWKVLRKKDIILFGLSKKKLFGTLPLLLNKLMGFITKLLEKQFKDSP